MTAEITLEDITRDIENAHPREFKYDMKFHREELVGVNPQQDSFRLFEVRYVLSVNRNRITLVPKKHIVIERKWATDPEFYKHLWHYHVTAIVYNEHGERVNSKDFKGEQAQKIYEFVRDATKRTAFTEEEKNMLSAI